MQVGSVNSFNFKGIESPKNFQAEDYKVGDGYTVRTAAADTMRSEEKIQKILEAVDKANNNVHVGTIVVGGLTLIGFLLQGKKGIDTATRVLATAAEGIAKTGVKLAGHFKKDSAGTQKMVDQISTSVGNFRDKIGKQDPKFLNGVREFVDKIFPNKGDSVAHILDKVGINNKISVASATVAGVGATMFADKISDVTENRLDNIDINRAQKEARNEGIHLMGEIFDAVL